MKPWPKPTLSKGRPKNGAGGDSGGRCGGWSSRRGRARVGPVSSASGRPRADVTTSSELRGGATSGKLGDGGSELDREQCLRERSSYPIFDLPTRDREWGSVCVSSLESIFANFGTYFGYQSPDGAFIGDSLACCESRWGRTYAPISLPCSHPIVFWDMTNNALGFSKVWKYSEGCLWFYLFYVNNYSLCTFIVTVH
jgi:hypothetical protein